MPPEADQNNTLPTVSEYMHRNIISIPGEASLQEAARMMAEQSVGALLVAQGDQYIGIISEKRLAREGAAKGLKPETAKVQSVMRPQPISIESNRTVQEAQALMKSKAVRHLVVTEGGKIVGIVSLSDLIPYYTDFFENSG